MRGPIVCGSDHLLLVVSFLGWGFSGLSLLFAMRLERVRGAVGGVLFGHLGLEVYIDGNTQEILDKDGMGWAVQLENCTDWTEDII